MKETNLVNSIRLLLNQLKFSDVPEINNDNSVIFIIGVDDGTGIIVKVSIEITYGSIDIRFSYMGHDEKDYSVPNIYVKDAIKFLSYINDYFDISPFVYTMEFEHNINKFVSYVRIEVLDQNTSLDSEDFLMIKYLIINGSDEMFSLANYFQQIINEGKDGKQVWKEYFYRDYIATESEKIMKLMDEKEITPKQALALINEVIDRYRQKIEE